MKCTNKKRKACCLILSAIFALTGCGSSDYAMHYENNQQVSSFQLVQTDNAQTAEPFAADLCVADSDVSNPCISISDVGAAGLFDLNELNTLYAVDVNKQVHPASLTKIMTALVALKYGSTDQVLTASENVVITESGAQLCGLKPGDTMTLGQALHILLIYSANDVAIMIAEGVGGSVEGFLEMMNEEAQAIGATNCHFVNPNGLTEDEHYVTAYDLYLIFQEALQYDLFNEIIQMTSYSTIYTNRDGEEKSLEIETTNQFIKGNYAAPDNVTIIGGKTGTTNAAGHCLILLARNNSGDPYISIIMNSSTTDDLYAQMAELLKAVQ